MIKKLLKSVQPTSALLAFHTLADVLAGIEALNHDYVEHARAARLIAEEYFDSDKVLIRLLDKMGGV